MGCKYRKYLVEVTEARGGTNIYKIGVILLNVFVYSVLNR